LRITSAPTLKSAIQTARGTCLAALLVSSAAATVASKPMNAQPPTASAARSAGKVPPLSASAPNVFVSTPKPCSRKTNSSARPMPTDAISSAPTPTRSAPLSASTPNALMIEHTSTRIAAVMTIAAGVGETPSRISAHGAPRYAMVVFATANAHSPIQPVNQP
jgi:hypothetical protein